MHTPYDNLTDKELLRAVEGSKDPMVRALAERLEMRHRDIEDGSDTGLQPSYIQAKHFIR